MMKIIGRIFLAELLFLSFGIALQIVAPANRASRMLIAPAAAQNYSCENPPYDEPDGDGDECTNYVPKLNMPANDGHSSGDTNNSPCSVSCGDPIDFATGNYYRRAVDYESRGPLPLKLIRYYNSQDNATYSFGSWHSSYSRFISSPSANVAIVTQDDGRQLTFTLANGVWTADSSVDSRLVQTATGWTYITAKDATETYNAQGRLTAFSNRAGLTETFSYDTDGNLVTVTGPFGRQLKFSYEPENGSTGYLVNKVVVPDGGTYTYAYDAANNLVSVTHPDGSVRQYVYEDGTFPHALTGIIDEDGNRYATITYDTQGRATSSQLAGGVDSYQVDYTYFSLGYVSVTNPLGASYAYYLDAINGLAVTDTVTRTCSNCNGYYSSASEYTYYDANGNVTQRTDYNGNSTAYTYDTTRNLVTSVTDATGRTTDITWDNTYRLPTQIVAPDRTTSFTYDSHGNLLKRSISDGSSVRAWTYAYNSNGQLLTADGPRTDVADVTSLGYDAQGNLTSITNALGQTTRITSYDADGRPLTMKNPNGLVTTLTYNFRGQVTSREVGGELTTYDYDPAGNLIKMTRPDGSFLAFTYDHAQRLIGVADALGNSTTLTLDGAGNCTQVQVYNSSGTLVRSGSAVYDQLSRMYQLIDAYNDTTTYTYDSNGNRVSITDPLGNTAYDYYDAVNRLTESVNPNYGVTYFGYDGNFHLTSVTDPKNLTTDYTYDGLDDKTTKVSPDTGTTTRTFDAAGNVVSSTDARGDTTTYAYDALNRLVKKTFADGSTTTFQYDQGQNGIGHMTSMTDPSGSTAWTYDQHGRVLTKSQTIGSVTLTTSMTYDAAGRLASITYPSGQTITMTYDADGQVSGLLADGVPLAVQVAYQPFGAVSSWLAGNGTLYQRTFDQAGRIASISLLSHFAPYTSRFSYDAASRITGIDNTALPTGTALPSQSFTYDAQYRLTGYSTSAASQTYSYDSDGNRASLTGSSTTSYTYGSSNNELLSAVSGSSTTGYSYDADGNTIKVAAPSGDATYTYDARDRMVMSNVGGNVTHYLVNGLGQRVEKTGWGARTASGGAIMFVYDGAGQLTGEYDGSGNPIEETVWLGSLPVAVLMPGQQNYFVYPDQLGAPRKIASRTGQIVWSWSHGPFGDGQPSGSITYNLRYPGQYYDDETGTDYNYRRDYDPSIGRYVESDPVGLNGGIDTYSYVLNDPEYLADPTGTCTGTPQQKQKCTAAQKAAGQLADQLETVSSETGDIALVSAVGTALSGAGEAATAGADTPVTVSLATVTDYFGTVSFVTGAGAAGFRSFANGNTSALGNFDWSNLVRLAAQVAASKIPGLASWADVIGHLAGEGTALSLTAQAACT